MLFLLVIPALSFYIGERYESLLNAGTATNCTTVNDSSVLSRSPTSTNGKSNIPSAAIDSSTLTTSSTMPRISGSYANMTDNALEILILKGDVAMPQNPDPTTLSGDVWDDFSDHGGLLDMHQTSAATTTSGNWSDDITDKLKPGLYSVGIYTYSNIYNDGPDGGYMGDTPHTLIAIGTLRIGK